MPWRHSRGSESHADADGIASEDVTNAQRRGRWRQDGTQLSPEEMSPAAWLGPDIAFDNANAGGQEGPQDDEGESLMVSIAGREGRKMYFQTLDDSMREQGLEDNELGATHIFQTSVTGPGSHNEPMRGVAHKKEFSSSAKAVAKLNSSAAVAKDQQVVDSASALRNNRRAKQRAKARGSKEDMPQEPGGCVVLIREDCRLHDNPALHAASEEHPWVVPLYVHDDDDPSPWPVRGAGLWWRHASLECFDSSLRLLGSRIVYRKGQLMEQVMDVLFSTGATALYFNLQLEPWHHTRDLELESIVAGSLGIQVRSFTAMVMKFEPWEERRAKKDSRLDDEEGNQRSETHVLYTGAGPRLVQEPLPTVRKKLPAPPDGWPMSVPLAALGYGRTAGRKIPPGFRQFNEKRQAHQEAGGWCGNPKEDDWAYEMRTFWPMGEEAAMKRLEEWLKEAAWGCYFPPGTHPRDQAGGRFRADKAWTAMISPYLRFGDLSPRYVEWRVKQALPFELRNLFLKRVVWRDKAYSQLYRCQDSHSVSIREQYESQTWSGTRLALRRWQRGETGFPLVDAGMRQLWKVGWMCNHLRHVTAQFLIEHMDLSWKDGFAWYDYTLVDTDVAINAMMWQMGGHSGIGSWNFVMHPIYAGKKVDPDGTYVRRWLPELRHLPTEYIHCPWEAPAGVSLAANVLLNGVYFQRVIEDLVAARLIHQKQVIAVRKLFPQFVKADGNEIALLSNGQVLNLDVRDDIRENDENNITLMMTPDDPRSTIRRNLGNTKGVHSTLIYEETKRFDSLYDAFDAAPRREKQRPSRSKDRAKERLTRRNQNGMLVTDLA